MSLSTVPVATRQVAVVGSGFVGLSCALHLQRLGHQVTLVDGTTVGSPAQASYGNAGTFAKYANIPVNKSGIVWEVPGMLANPDGPLALKRTPYLVKMPPWGSRFIAASAQKRVSQISDSLSHLLRHAESGWEPVWEQANLDIEKHRVANGCLYLFSTDEALEAARPDTVIRRQVCNVDELSAAQVAKLEPNVSQLYAGGLLFDAWHVKNPGFLASELLQGFSQAGGRVLKQKASKILDGPSVALEFGGHLVVDEVVVAAGAYSRSLAKDVGDKIPLDTERGYHVTFSGQSSVVSRPVGWADGGFYMTPMSHGLRIAGTVELGGLKAPPTKSRCDMLERTAQKLLVKLPNRDPDGDWLGFRPTLPDSLPVIGRSPKAPGVTYAFGHQHIGLTLGGITGQLVAELVSNKSPSVNLRPYRPERFDEHFAGEALDLDLERCFPSPTTRSEI